MKIQEREALNLFPKVQYPEQLQAQYRTAIAFYNYMMSIIKLAKSKKNDAD
ncbi:hypothetical protein NXG27_00925 [Megasphaera paucivorans]|uniref:hypothetical protein n=1 Tax=Megasphaera paucivorans TaxID=349095 RepID=UPI0015A35B1D|nr:hypothetical protein [Megasphaera paucivorans]